MLEGNREQALVTLHLFSSLGNILIYLKHYYHSLQRSQLSHVIHHSCLFVLDTYPYLNTCHALHTIRSILCTRLNITWLLNDIQVRVCPVCAQAKLSLASFSAPDELPYCVAPAAISERERERKQQRKNMHHSINRALQQAHLALLVAAKSIPHGTTVESSGINLFVHMSDCCKKERQIANKCLQKHIKQKLKKMKKNLYPSYFFQCEYLNL